MRLLRRCCPYLAAAPLNWRKHAAQVRTWGVLVPFLVTTDWSGQQWHNYKIQLPLIGEFELTVSYNFKVIKRHKHTTGKVSGKLAPVGGNNALFICYFILSPSQTGQNSITVPSFLLSLNNKLLESLDIWSPISALDLKVG